MKRTREKGGSLLAVLVAALLVFAALTSLGSMGSAKPRIRRPQLPKRLWPDFAVGQMWDTGEDVYHVVMIETVCDDGRIVACRYDLLFGEYVYAWLDTFVPAEAAEWRFLCDPWVDWR